MMMTNQPSKYGQIDYEKYMRGKTTIETINGYLQNNDEYVICMANVLFEYYLNENLFLFTATSLQKRVYISFIITNKGSLMLIMDESICYKKNDISFSDSNIDFIKKIFEMHIRSNRDVITNTKISNDIYNVKLHIENNSEGENNDKLVFAMHELYNFMRLIGEKQQKETVSLEGHLKEYKVVLDGKNNLIVNLNETINKLEMKVQECKYDFDLQKDEFKELVENKRDDLRAYENALQKVTTRELELIRINAEISDENDQFKIRNDLLNCKLKDLTVNFEQMARACQEKEEKCKYNVCDATIQCDLYASAYEIQNNEDANDSNKCNKDNVIAEQTELINQLQEMKIFLTNAVEEKAALIDKTIQMYQEYINKINEQTKIINELNEKTIHKMRIENSELFDLNKKFELENKELKEKYDKIVEEKEQQDKRCSELVKLNNQIMQDRRFR
jgi:hypothetical protein